MVTRVLVTGGDGFLGSHLMDMFRNTGAHEVRSYDISQGQDIRDTAKLAEVFNDFRPSVVVHLAAIANLNHYDEHSDDVNITATGVIADLCIQHGARMVFASTCCLYGDNRLEHCDETSPVAPTEDYARGKGKAEQVLHAKTLAHPEADLVIARLATFYGSAGMRKALFKAIVVEAAFDPSREVVIYNSGHQRRTYTHVEDVASGLFILSTAPRELMLFRTYNVTAQERISVLDVVATVSRLSGRPVSVRWATPEETRKEDFDQACIHRGRLAALGHTLKYTFEEGMAECIAAYQAAGCTFSR